LCRRSHRQRPHPGRRIRRRPGRRLPRRLPCGRRRGIPPCPRQRL
jgi:hypothetical protein